MNRDRNWVRYVWEQEVGATMDGDRNCGQVLMETGSGSVRMEIGSRAAMDADWKWG